MLLCKFSGYKLHLLEVLLQLVQCCNIWKDIGEKTHIIFA